MNQCVTVFSKFLLDHIISEAVELFVLFAYHTLMITSLMCRGK